MTRKFNYIFIIIMIMFITSVSAENTKKYKTTADEAPVVLKALNIIPETGVLTEGISRADFAVYTARMIGINDFAQAKKRYFYDVPTEHYAATAVNSLVERGIISLPENKEFRPDDIITTDEAYKIIACVLGYGQFAEENGGFPKGYRTAILDAEIADYEVAAGNLSSKDGLLLIAKALEAPMMEYSGVNAFGGITQEKTENTLLSTYHDIYIDSGIIVAANGERMYTDIDVKADEVVIGELFFETKSDYSEYLGSCVKYFYRELDGQGEELVCILNKTKKEDLRIDIKEFESYSSGKLVYQKNNSEKSVSVSNPVVVYNGEPVVAELQKVLSKDNLSNGEIILRSTTMSGDYDLLIVNDYKDMYLTNVNLSGDEPRLVDGEVSGKSVELKDADVVRFYDKDGTEIDNSYVTKDIVLSLRTSGEENKIVKAYVSTDVVAGNLSEISNGSEYTYLTVDGVKYQIKSDSKQLLNLEVGKPYSFYRNVFGEVVYIKAGQNTDEKWGYFYKARVIEEDTGELAGVFTVFTENGKHENIKLAPKVVIDGQLCKNMNEVNIRFKNSTSGITPLVNDEGVSATLDPVSYDMTSWKPMLMSYKLKDDKIISIDTIYFENGVEDKSKAMERLNLVGAETTFYGGRFGRKGIVSANSKFFTVPSNNRILEGARDDEFKVSARTFSNQTEYRGISLCKRGNQSAYYTTGVIVSGTIDMTGSAGMLVTNVSVGLNADGEPSKIIKGLQSGAEVSYNVSSDVRRVKYWMTDGSNARETIDFGSGTEYIEDISKGDIIRIATSGGEITSIQLVFDYSINPEGKDYEAELLKPEYQAFAPYIDTSKHQPNWRPGLFQDVNVNKLEDGIEDNLKSAEPNWYFPGQGGRFWWYSTQFTYGYVADIEGNALLIDYDYDTLDTDEEEIDEVYNNQNCYMFYDTKTDTAWSGTIDEIMDAKSYGKERCSSVVIHTARAPKGLFIYLR